ncbi:CACNA1F, partial [Symbiodinium microadriaticum]
DWTWALLDLIIVVSSIWEIIVQHAQDAMPPGEESELGTIAGISSLKAFRIIRITRILKTVQVVRILRFVVALRTLVTSIFGTLKSLLWALVLILLIEYVFAILFTQAVNDFLNDLPASHDVDVTIMDASRLYFENVFTTMLSHCGS